MPTIEDARKALELQLPIPSHVLVQYRPDPDRGEPFEIYNTRLGTVPRHCDTEDGHGARAVGMRVAPPDYRPRVGDRVIVDMTLQRARIVANETLATHPDDGSCTCESCETIRQAAREGTSAKALLEDLTEFIRSTIASDVVHATSGLIEQLEHERVTPDAFVFAVQLTDVNGRTKTAGPDELLAMVDRAKPETRRGEKNLRMVIELVTDARSQALAKRAEEMEAADSPAWRSVIKGAYDPLLDKLEQIRARGEERLRERAIVHGTGESKSSAEALWFGEVGGMMVALRLIRRMVEETPSDPRGRDWLAATVRSMDGSLKTVLQKRAELLPRYTEGSDEWRAACSVFDEASDTVRGIRQRAVERLGEEPTPEPMLRAEPGWIGNFTRRSAEGALPNGTRIVKRASEPGDSHRDGALGTVLGSVRAPDGNPVQGVLHCYFIEWDARPRCAVGTIDLKVKRADVQ